MSALEEVVECTNDLLNDFRAYDAKKRAKDTELATAEKQLKKLTSSLNKGLTALQQNISDAYNNAISTKNSVPSEDAFKQLNDENVQFSPDNLTLANDLKQPVDAKNSLPDEDYERLQSFAKFVRKMLDTSKSEN